LQAQQARLDFKQTLAMTTDRAPPASDLDASGYKKSVM
jgi:hypothetical protein